MHVVGEQSGGVQPDLSGLDLPDSVRGVLVSFLAVTRSAFGKHLRSAVLFGSAAEGRLRPTSDVNLVLVLSAFKPSDLDPLRQPLTSAKAAIQLHVMFLVEDEIPALLDAFPEKLADILRRHRVLYGEDPFRHLSISRTVAVARLKQVLLNLILRLRFQYVACGLYEGQLVLLVAEFAGPMRSCAATLCELEGKTVVSPKQALSDVAASLPEHDWEDALRYISEARETRALPANTAASTVQRLIGLAREMLRRAGELRPDR